MATRNIDIFQDVLALQKEICKKYDAEFAPVDLELFVAISDGVDGATFPVHGLRFPQEGYGTGWYLWAGDGFSDDPDFFKPVHGKHLLSRCPQVMKFLALPPGHRFIVDDEGNMAVHFDETLVEN